MSKKESISVQGTEMTVITSKENDYIMKKVKEKTALDFVIDRLTN
jgi:hypothetical protein